MPHDRGEDRAGDLVEDGSHEQRADDDTEDDAEDRLLAATRKLREVLLARDVEDHRGGLAALGIPLGLGTLATSGGEPAAALLLAWYGVLAVLGAVAGRQERRPAYECQWELRTENGTCFGREAR